MAILCWAAKNSLAARVQQMKGQGFTIVKLSRTMLDNDCNILVNMTKAEYKDFRTLMVDMVLHTGHQEKT